MACVVFNLAAVISYIASLKHMEKIDKRNDIDSLKHEEKINEKKETNEEENEIAMKYFQVSAGLFLSIKDILKDNNLKDMGGKSIDCLNKLMLAQAQECYLEMEIKKKAELNRLLEIAYSLGKTYEDEILNMMIDLKPQFDRTWIKLIEVNKPII